MNLFQRLSKIASLVLADLNFTSQEQFEEYLKNHPNTRKDTKFFVNGVEVKAPNQGKKKEKKEVGSYDMNKLKSDESLRGWFGRNIEKMISLGMDLENPPTDILEKIFNSTNETLTEGKLKPFTKSEFKELFETFAKEYVKKEKERRKEEKNKGEEEKKKEAEKIVDYAFSDERRESLLKKEYERVRKTEEEEVEYMLSRVEKYCKENGEEFDREKELQKHLKYRFDYVSLNGFEEFKKNISGTLRGTPSEKELEIINNLNPDFQDLYNETNEKLKERGLPEISVEEFRRRYNEKRIPLIGKNESLDDFCLKNISKNFYCNTYNFFLLRKAINNMQTIKREFPNLYKVKINNFGIEIPGHESIGKIASAFVFSDEFEGVSFGFTHSFYNGYNPDYLVTRYEKDGKVFELGFNYMGEKHKPHSMGEGIEYITSHEMGHLTKDLFHIYNGGLVRYPTGQKSRAGKEIYKVAPRSPKSEKIEQDIEDLYNESLKNGDIFKLTWYASAEPEEFWAEIFAMYYHNKNLLPPNILTKLEEIINALKS